MKTQIQLLIILALMIGMPISLTAQGPISFNEKIKEIEKITEEFRQEYDVPSITIGLTVDGEEIFVNQGHYDRSKIRMVDEHSIYQTASVSKIFAGIIINSLILEGKISQIESITTYLPANYPADILSKLQPITVRDLLHHRSGLPGDSKILRKKRKGNQAFIYDYSDLDFEKDLSQMRLKSQPGEIFNYSNFGYALLGFLAENVTGKSYEQLIEQYVREPYGLRYSPTNFLDKNKLVTAYRKDKRKLVIEPWQMGKLVPPSGLFSSASDLLILAKHQLTAYNMGQSDPLILTNDTRPVHEGSGVAYGYGFREYEGFYWHGGEMDGYAAMHAINPATNSAYVILSSCNGDELSHLSRKISGILYR